MVASSRTPTFLGFAIRLTHRLLQLQLILRGPLRPATTVYPNLRDNFPDNGVVPTVLAQCQAEQRYVRESMTRTLMYAQVSRSLPWRYRAELCLI